MSGEFAQECLTRDVGEADIKVTYEWNSVNEMERIGELSASSRNDEPGILCWMRKGRLERRGVRKLEAVMRAQGGIGESS